MSFYGAEVRTENSGYFDSISLHRVALTADIEKAFLMVSVMEKDRDVLRSLWFDDVFNKEDPNLIVLRFARVFFGVSSSLFSLMPTYGIMWNRLSLPIHNW